MNNSPASSLQVFEAGSSDINWINRIYHDAARSGNFGYDVEDSAVVKNLESNLRSIIKRRRMKGSERETQTIVFEQGRTRIGFCIMAQIVGQPHAAELHMMLVASKYRNMGFGQKMLIEIIERYHPYVDLFARCYPGATVMAGLLKKHGFYNSKTFEDDTVLYLLPMVKSVQGVMAANIHGHPACSQAYERAEEALK